MDDIDRSIARALSRATGLDWSRMTIEPGPDGRLTIGMLSPPPTRPMPDSLRAEIERRGARWVRPVVKVTGRSSEAKG